MAEVRTDHQLYYMTEADIPVWQVSEALAALDSIVKTTPAVLESFFEGTSIDDVELYLRELRAGSLWEDFFVKFLFGTQEELDGFIDRTRERMGMDKLSDNSRILSAVILTLVLVGGSYAVTQFLKNPEAAVHIEANNNVIISIGAEASGMSPEDFISIIRAAVSDERKLANDAIRVIRPAKQGEGGGLQMDGDASLSIDRETIAAIPSDVFPEQPDETLEDYRDVEIEIRATDLDSHKRGWGVRIPVLSERRLPMQIDAMIDTSELAAGSRFRGDVTAVMRLSKEGDRVPRRIYLREIQESAPDRDEQEALPE